MICWRRSEEINMKTLLSLLVVISFSTKAFGAAPYFTNPSNYPTLTDDSPPGTLYYTFKATDPGGKAITYSLENTITDWLEIEASNGTTTVKKKIDREAMLSIKNFQVYAINTASEKGQLRVILQFIDVNNKPPIMTNIPKTINITEITAVDTELYTVLYEDKDDQINQQTEVFLHGGNEDRVFRMVNSEVYLNKSLDYDNGKRQYVLNITAKGTQVVQVDAYDLDNLGERAEYRIFPDSNKGNLYSIDSSTGQISVNGQLELGSQTLVVTANSKKHGAVITFVTITMVAVRNLKFDASVSEGSQNVVVMDLSTIEASFNVSGASFSIQSGNTGNHFVLTATELIVASVALDREAIPNYWIVVKLTKNTTVLGLATINISVGDVNDNSPHFEPSSYNVSVNEDLPVGSNVVKVTANDPDYGLNGTVKYAITGFQGIFFIHECTGQVILLKSLDHEKVKSYVLLVQAFDYGTPPRTNSTNVTINIMDINYNSSVVSPTIEGTPSLNPELETDTGSLEVGILAAFLAVSLLINILIVVFIAVWKLRTNKQNNVKNEDAPVYYNADALEMVSSSSTMNQQISSNPGQEYQERRESTGNSNQNQDHYQQLNPDTLQSNTDAAPTYETLNGVRIGERNDQHTYQSLLNQPRFYQSLQSYANVDTA